jgi:hypothetical protein
VAQAGLGFRVFSTGGSGTGRFRVKGFSAQSGSGTGQFRVKGFQHRPAVAKAGLGVRVFSTGRQWHRPV